MGKGICRVGDKWEGICYNHDSPISVTGEIITGIGFCTVNGISTARHGDIVEATCGHTDTIVATATTLDIDGIPPARVDDRTTGSPLDGALVEGSPSTTTT